jgi:hypothetical protein
MHGMPKGMPRLATASADRLKRSAAGNSEMRLSSPLRIYLSFVITEIQNSGVTRLLKLGI